MSNLLNKPGKMGIAGHMVQDLYAEGQLKRINDYCRCDVLDTYFVFLRYLVLAGQLNIDLEQQLVASTKEWLVERAEQRQAFSDYLDHWSDWTSPWNEANSTQPTSAAEDAALTDDAAPGTAAANTTAPPIEQDISSN